MDTIIRQSLAAQRQLISIEAIGLEQMGKTGSLLRLPSFVENFVETVSETLREFRLRGSKRVDLKAIPKLVKKMNYVEMMDKDFPKPTGMKGGFGHTLTVLEEWDKEIVDVEKRLITPLSNWLGELLMYPERLGKSYREDKFKTSDIEALRTRLATAFDGRDQTAETNYGDVVVNNGEWTTILERAHELHLNFARSDLDKLKQAVMDLTETAEQLAQLSKEDPERYNISGNTLKILVDAIYHAATEVELYSIYGYHLEMVLNSFERCEKALKKM